MPPAPACISKKISKLSFSPERKHLISNCLISFNNFIILFEQSERVGSSDSSKASLFKSLRFLISFSVLLKKLKIFSKKFFSFSTFFELFLSFQKFSFKISLFNWEILVLMLFPSKIPPDV